MAINLDSYRFRGTQAEGRGSSLSEAIDDLADFWASRPSLVQKAWGVLTLQITIGSTSVTIEITDPDILDDLETGHMQSLIDKLAEDMQLDRRDAEALLDESSDVVATVDRIRPPSQPKAWSPDAGTEPDKVLPQASIAWIRDVAKDVDREARRDKGRVRTRRGKTLLRMVVQSGQQQGLTDSEISKRTGIPKSTVRDARMRVDRDKRVVAEFQSRRPGQRYTAEQKQIVMERLKESDGNAAEVARQLGLAPRTVRGIRARASTPKAKRRSYTKADRSKLFSLVEKGMNPTEASRELGIAPRTGRGWVRKEKIRRESEE